MTEHMTHRQAQLVILGHENAHIILENFSHKFSKNFAAGSTHKILRPISKILTDARGIVDGEVTSEENADQADKAGEADVADDADDPEKSLPEESPAAIPQGEAIVEKQKLILHLDVGIAAITNETLKSPNGEILEIRSPTIAFTPTPMDIDEQSGHSGTIAHGNRSAYTNDVEMENHEEFQPSETDEQQAQQAHEAENSHEVIANELVQRWLERFEGANDVTGNFYKKNFPPP